MWNESACIIYYKGKTKKNDYHGKNDCMGNQQDPCIRCSVFYFVPTCKDEVHLDIKKMNPIKAPGHDSIDIKKHL